MSFVLPRVCVAPMLLETLLEDFHLLDGSLFCIFLHTGIQRGVYLQPVGIEVRFVFFVYAGYRSFLAQHVDVLRQDGTEVGGDTVVATFFLSWIYNHGKCHERIELCTSGLVTVNDQMTMVV